MRPVTPVNLAENGAAQRHMVRQPERRLKEQEPEEVPKNRSLRVDAALGGASVKKIQSFASAILLVLFLVGCRQPTNPSFSPDGKSLAFERGGSLFLRTSAGDRKISDDVAGDVAWSENGESLAFASGQGTTVLDLVKLQFKKFTKVRGPYVWQGDLLLGMAEQGNNPVATAVTIDTRSAGHKLRADVPFSPSDMYALPNGEVLMFDGRQKAYRFDGLSADPLPRLNGMEVLASRNGGQEWLLRKSFAKPHTHEMLVRLLEWNAQSSGSPHEVATLDLTSALSDRDNLVVVQEVKAAGDWGRLGAVVLVTKFPAADRKRLSDLIDRYDMFNDLNRPDGLKMSKADQAFMKSVFDRATVSEVCLTGSRNGPWSTVERQAGITRKTPGQMHVALNRDGTKMAVSTEKGTKIYSFNNPVH